MTRIDVFDPPLCCSSGVCGPSVDPQLAAFAADVQWLTTQGVEVVRHNLAQVPQDFVTNETVRTLLADHGDGCLPVVLVNGEVRHQGAYPRRDELARESGLVVGVSPTKPRIRVSVTGTGGCAPGSGCC
ncbi:arsenite efflux transporter metallochaperone ArsD [Luteitalea sp.]|uniref:arsenite efflux transporter metallochaperone ArsD n=1 Tax=Luteitalea sp. TaxID=2004800 RepID=UPI000AA3B43E|nr:arsenite efflux transporter metallochaperone ArsD [Luteitalea sp.]